MNRVVWMAVATVALMGTGCGDEGGRQGGAGAGKTGDGSMVMPKRGEPQMQQASSATQPAEKAVPGSEIPADAQESLRGFVTALAAGDAEGARKLFMPREVFEKVFTTDNLESYFNAQQHAFNDSLDKLGGGLKGTRIVSTDLDFDGHAAELTPGSHVGEARLTGSAMVLNDVAVVVEQNSDPSKEVAVQIERLIKTDRGWFAIDPIQVGPRLRNKPR
jgi:hypothetical protein